MFDKRATDRLGSIGEWMKYNGPSIYGCTQAPAQYVVPDNSLLTYNPEKKKLYIHLLDYPLNSLVLKGYADKIKYVQFLHDNSEIKYSDVRGDDYSATKPSQNDIVLTLPVQKPEPIIPVIEITLK